MKNKTRTSLCSALAAVFTATIAHAATLYWDGATPAGAPGGGAGTWDTSTTNWDTSLAGADVAWVNANKDTAFFGGTAGAVTLGSSIDVGGLTFNTTGYGITSTGNSLNFAATNNTVLFNNIAAATITGPVGGSGNVILTAFNTNTAGTLTLNGTSTGGWSGTTSVNSGMTLSLAADNQGLNNTTGLTLNGGNLTLTNTSATAITNNRVSNATITSNGGTFTYTNTSGTGVYAETIGTVALTSGQMNFNLATNQAGAGSQTLTLSALTQSGSSAVTFSAATTGPNATKNRILVSGASATPAGQIIGAWATTGTAANNQNDYAVYDASGYIVPANIAASAETTWTNAANAYTLSTPAKTATALTATRNIAALKASSTATVTSSTTTAGSPTFTIASGHSFNVGDPVVLSSLSGDIGGQTQPYPQLTVGTVYYVAGVTGTTFTLAPTPGGTAINAGQARTAEFTGGLKLDSGINLGTTGILNSGNAPLAIGRTAAGGQVTLPAAGAGNLYVTTGLAPNTGTNNGLNGRISIEAPIVDNGGALTLVKNGAGVLRLQGTSNYSGGTVINSGTVIFTDGSSGANFGTGGITFNGSGALSFGPNYSFAFAAGGTIPLSRPITVNSGAIAGFYYNSPNTTMNTTAAITGDGGIISGKDPVVTYVGGDGTIGINFTSTGNTFTGPLTINNATATFNSLADSTSPMILSSSFTYGSGAIASLSVPSRLVDVRANSTITNSAGSSRTVTFGDISTTTGGAKTLTLSNGSGNGAGFVTGTITNGAGTISVAKTGTGTFTISGNMSHTGGLTSSGSGTLNVSGTNTYRGGTTLGFANPGSGFLVFQGIQALPAATTISQTHSGGTGSHGTVKLLDDSATPAARSAVDLTFNHSNNSMNSFSVFVGNNGAANGGNGAGGTTGSTIQLGNMNFNQGSGQTAGSQLALTGANNYKLQIGNVNISLQAAFAGTWPVRLTASQPLIVTGDVRQLAGATSANVTLQLDGTGSTGLISGGIKDSADGSPRVLNLTKNNTTTVWTLSGANTYSGATTVSGGTLAGIGANAFGSTSGISIAGTGILSLRGDSSTSFVKASDSSAYSVTTTASGATLNADQATIAGTGAKTMTIGTLGTTSTAATYQVNFTGANNTSLSTGAATGPASTAVATVTFNNNIAAAGSLTLASYNSANTSGGETVIFTGTGNTTVSGAITPSATTLALTKTGRGPPRWPETTSMPG